MLRERVPDGTPVSVHIEREFRGFLTCGVLAHGLSRAHCGAECLSEHIRVTARVLDRLGQIHGNLLTVRQVRRRIPLFQLQLRLRFSLSWQLLAQHPGLRNVTPLGALVAAGQQTSLRATIRPAFTRSFSPSSHFVEVDVRRIITVYYN